MSNRFERIKARSEGIRNTTFQEFWAEVVGCSVLVKQIRSPKRRLWLSDVIEELYQQQNGKCALSGEALEPNFEVDHIIPFSYWGRA